MNDLFISSYIIRIDLLRRSFTIYTVTKYVCYNTVSWCTTPRRNTSSSTTLNIYGLVTMTSFLQFILVVLRIWAPTFVLDLVTKGSYSNELSAVKKCKYVLELDNTCELKWKKLVKIEAIKCKYFVLLIDNLYIKFKRNYAILFDTFDCEMGKYV